MPASWSCRSESPGMRRTDPQSPRRIAAESEAGTGPAPPSTRRTDIRTPHHGTAVFIQFTRASAPMKDPRLTHHRPLGIDQLRKAPGSSRNRDRDHEIRQHSLRVASARSRSADIREMAGSNFRPSNRSPASLRAMPLASPLLRECAPSGSRLPGMTSTLFTALRTARARASRARVLVLMLVVLGVLRLAGAPLRARCLGRFSAARGRP